MTDKTPDRDQLDALAKRIREAEEKADPARKRKAVSDWGSNRGFMGAARIASDFVATVMVPMVAGAFADKHFGTGPLLTVGFLFAGFIFGFYRLVRALDDRKKQDPKTKDRGEDETDG